MTNLKTIERGFNVTINQTSLLTSEMAEVTIQDAWPQQTDIKKLREEIDAGTSKAFKANWQRIPFGKKSGLAIGLR
jgi:hypothetical protein